MRPSLKPTFLFFFFLSFFSSSHPPPLLLLLLPFFRINNSFDPVFWLYT
jgi:hypothetical protein